MCSATHPGGFSSKFSLVFIVFTKRMIYVFYNAVGGPRAKPGDKRL